MPTPWKASRSGRTTWARSKGPWGTAACPIIVDQLVIQNCDADEDANLIAFDKRTGKEVWRTKRRDYRGWSTPIVVDTGKRRELVLNGHEGVQAYDPASGKELWFCSSPVGRGEPTITPAGDLLCVVNGLKGGEFYAVRPGGDGDVSDTHRAWSTPRQGRPRHAVADRRRPVHHRQRHGRRRHLLRRRRTATSIGRSG